jgi:hypothetical protein
VFCVAVSEGEVGAELGDTDTPDGFENAQSLQNGHVHGQKGFPDMKTGVAIFFQQHYVPTVPGHDAAESRSRRPTADYQYVRLSCRHWIAARGRLAN